MNKLRSHSLFDAIGRGILWGISGCLIVFGVIVLVAWLAKGADVTLEWNGSPSVEEVKGYAIWHATNIAGPWERITNSIGTETNATVNVPVGVHFFFVTATNFWGESEPSNIAWTPPKASAIEKVKIERK